MIFFTVEWITKLPPAFALWNFQDSHPSNHLIVKKNANKNEITVIEVGERPFCYFGVLSLNRNHVTGGRQYRLLC